MVLHLNLKEIQMIEKLNKTGQYRKFARIFSQTLNFDRAWTDSKLDNPFQEYKNDTEFQEIWKEEIDNVIGMFDQVPVALLKMPLLRIIGDETAKNSEKTAAIKTLADKNWQALEEKADTCGDLIRGLQGDNVVPFPKKKIAS